MKIKNRMMIGQSQYQVAGDKRISDLAVRHLGDPDRWREIWELNDMKKGQKIRAGDCFLLPAE
ncbi:MAG: hypothetical protein OXH90_03585 [Paracoccaceae bacterium]|nr:hypothetical protein [Paracoccaceae bacterium]